MNSYESLEKLNDLRQRGIISEEEFQAEKKKLLDGNVRNVSHDGLIWGMPPNTYCMLMHLSSLLWMTFIGVAAPVLMWALNKDQFSLVDRHGKNILNWLISATIYAAVAGILSFVLIGIPFLVATGVLVFVFGIIGALKAYKGEVWEYPLSIQFFK